MLHPAILYEIAPALSPVYNRTFWGSELQNTGDNIKKVLGVGRTINLTERKRGDTITLSEPANDFIQGT